MKRKYLGEKSLKDLIDFIKGDLNEKINTKDHITEDKTIEIWNSITGADIPNANSLVHTHDERYYLKTEIDNMMEILTYNDVGADPAGSAEIVQTNLTSHANDKSNPHEVSCEQILALPLAGGTMSGTIISDLNGSDDTPELQSNLDNGSLLKLYVNNKNNKASIRFGTDDTLPPADNERITLRGVKDPVDESDAVNKSYVDREILHYGVCNTAADVANKDVTIEGITEYREGERFSIFFSNGTTIFNGMKLNINGIGTKDIIVNFNKWPEDIFFEKGNIVEFIYSNNHFISITANAISLAHKRNFQVDLASNEAVPFNGRENCTMGTKGILPILKGGTGNTTGLAPSATKLATARTISLTSDVTGSTTFDGTANKSISCRLKNSGVVANTYGADVTKMAIDKWCSNNRGLHGTIATSTWVAKSNLTLKFTYTVSSESVSYDYLNITAAGSQLLANTGGNKASGTLTKALTTNQSIVFRYIKDSSGNRNDDCAIISAVKVTPSGGSEVAITTANINSYFNITDSTYAFLPLIELLPKETNAGGTTTGTNAFTLPTVTVNAKGVVTSASRVLIMPVSSSGGSATKLATARTIRTNLGSTSSASFDGTANITPGVTGTLPIAKGGTGNTTSAGAFKSLANNVSSILIGKNVTFANKLSATSYPDTIGIGTDLKCNNNSVTLGNLADTSGNGTDAVAIGTLATSKYIKATALGSRATTTGDNTMQLGDEYCTVYSYKSISVRSDRRDKVDINDSNLGLNFITKLRPVSYRMNPRESYFNNLNEDIVDEIDEEGNTIKVARKTVDIQEIDYSLTNDGSRARKRPHYGFIAQEVKEVMNELDIDFAGYLDASYDGGEDVLSLSYTEFIGPMVKAIQEQQEMINELKREVELLKS